MTITFIYQPKSGDRVFVSKAHPEMLIARYSNGCRHVYGGSPVLSWHTTGEGEYWRGRAKKVLSDIIDAVGGIGWDEKGHVQAIVPRNAAFNVLRWMDAAKNALDLEGAYHPDRGQTPQQENMYKLYMAGLARPKFPSDNVWGHLSPLEFEAVSGGDSPRLHWSVGGVRVERLDLDEATYKSRGDAGYGPFSDKWFWHDEEHGAPHHVDDAEHLIRCSRRVVFVWEYDLGVEGMEDMEQMIRNVWLHEGHRAPTPDSKWSQLFASSPQWSVDSILAATPETFPAGKEPESPKTGSISLDSYMYETREHR